MGQKRGNKKSGFKAQSEGDGLRLYNKWSNLTTIGTKPNAKNTNKFKDKTVRKGRKIGVTDTRNGRRKDN